MTEPAPRKSDLGVRVVSAVVMVVVAGTALWLGGGFFTGFAILVGLGVYWEWCGLVRKFADRLAIRALWFAFGFVYIGWAVRALILLRERELGAPLFAISLVIAVDIGAYFLGRTVGGPKIAPRISPSKTWAGLVGGMIGAATVLAAYDRYFSPIELSGFRQLAWHEVVPLMLGWAVMVAVVAQAGDFFESWMKRRAGVKDSGALIPGHGGLFDRVDGLIAVMFVPGIFALLGSISGLVVGR